MKKFFTFGLLLSFMFVLFGCSNTSTSLREYKNLTNEQVLVISTGERYVNNTTTVKFDNYLTKTISRTYNLIRSSSQTNNPGEFKYLSYWYRFTSTQTTDQELLGKQTTTVDTNYAYLIYSDNESLSVKKTVVTKSSFNYNGGWVEREYEKIVTLNGYFADEEALYLAIPEIATQIDADNIEKYYIDVTIPITTTTTYQQINTFYYFE